MFVFLNYPGTDISFEHDSYTTRVIKVISTRALDKYKLGKLVTIDVTSSTHDHDADLKQCKLARACTCM